MKNISFQFAEYLIAGLILCPLNDTRRHIPDYSNLHIQPRGKLKLHVAQNVEKN